MRRVKPWRQMVIAMATIGALFAITPAAQAEFTPPYATQCSGGSINAFSTGLQLQMANPWAAAFTFENIKSPLSCAGHGLEIRYSEGTSPEGLEALGAVTGARSREFRLVDSEEPPTAAQWLNIDVGDKPGEDSGLIRQIPVASTAVVPLVHFPAGCAIPAKEATSDGRFVVSNSALERAYAGETATWGELLPGIESSCASIPIKRVVPATSEGITFVFKQWLNTVNSSRGWPESSTMPNTTWPSDSGATATVRATGGDPGEAVVTAETSGAIGFASLPTARGNRFGFFSPENPKHENSGLFWLSLKNGAGERVEPTFDPRSGADNVLGANCAHPTFNYVPSGYDTTVTPIWRTVSAAGSKTGWPICTLNYQLAWDDASTVYGNSEAEQANQRTVKDFLAYILGPAGQEEANAEDYSSLPSAILADAQDGQSRVGWNKIPGSKEAKASEIKAQIAAAEKHTTS